MTYDELKQDIQDFLDYTDPTFLDNIDTFIKSAEKDILRAVTILDLRKSATASLTTSSRYLTMPTDYIAPSSLAITVDDSLQFLLMKDDNFVLEAFPDSTATGAPRYYGPFNNQTVVLGPVPDDDYDILLNYFYEPESIVTAGTSWLGDNAEEALRYGARYHGYLFMKGDSDLLQEYQNQFIIAIKALQDIYGVRAKVDTYVKPQDDNA